MKSYCLELAGLTEEERVEFITSSPEYARGLLYAAFSSEAKTDECLRGTHGRCVLFPIYVKGLSYRASGSLEGWKDVDAG
jgi:hypothetical protein